MAADDGSGLNTAADITSGVGGIASVIPIAGPIISAGAGIASGIMKGIAAKKQAAQAALVRQQALDAQKQTLRPEFLQAQRMRQMSVLAGLPGYDLASNALDANTAAAVRSIRESSPDGGSTLAAISAAIGQQNAAQNQLSIKNSEYKAGQFDKLTGDTWNIGEQQRGLEDRRDLIQKQGLQAASALENASTYNKQNGFDTITGAIGSTASALSSYAGKQRDDAKMINLMKLMYPELYKKMAAAKTGTATPAATVDPTATPYQDAGNYSLPDNVG